MSYDPATDICVSKNKCIDPLKYAVNSDGSVNKTGVCETGLDGCRCTSSVTCPVNVVSKFSVTNGNFFSTFSSDKNYIINELPYSDKTVYGSSLELDGFNEYCKLNSTYTGKLVNGCSFTNSSSDFLMDCDKESIFEDVSVGPYSLAPYTTDKNINKQFCEVQPGDDSNWNNMTLCMSKNVCRAGNLTYNYDIYRKNSRFRTGESKSVNNFLDSRRFCQASASDLSSYLSDLRYYTLSCMNGTKCNQLPKAIDIGKFFVGNNNDFDPTSITNTFRITLTNNGGRYTLQSQDTLILGYDPISRTLKNGDIILMEFNDSGPQKLYFIIGNSDPTNLTFDLYWFGFKPVDNGYGISYFTPTKYTLLPTDQDAIYTYYSQFGLNGFGYNTTQIITKPPQKIRNIDNTIITSFKCSNIHNDEIDTTTDVDTAFNLTVPYGTESVYIPVYSISKNKTFYRGGLSKPQGYVIQNEVREEEVQEEIDRENGVLLDNYFLKKTSFNPSLYSDISLYYSVWNNNYGRTECIRCGPLLVATVNMARIAGFNINTAYRYDAVTIQYSGRDFGHYRKNFFDEAWYFTSKSTTGSYKLASSPGKLRLTRPNFNVQKGDYVLSGKSDFDYELKPLKQLPPQFNGLSCIIYIGEAVITNVNEDNKQGIYYKQFSPFGTYIDTTDTQDISIYKNFGFGVNNNFYDDYTFGDYIITTYNFEKNNFDVDINKLNVKFMFGNKYTVVFEEAFLAFELNIYQDPNLSFFQKMESNSFLSDFKFQVALIAKNVVIDIDSTRKIITTNATGTKNIIPGTDLQFISTNRKLEMENDPSIVMPFNTVGSGAVISVDEITDGRITSINVDLPGNGYTNLSPKVMFKSYDQYLTNNIDFNYQKS